MDLTTRLFEASGAVGRSSLGLVREAGRQALFLGGALVRIFHPPFRLAQIVEHLQFIGIRSIGIVLLTSAFTGMVLTLQGFDALERFGATDMVGPLVALSLIRELGPVLAALMLTARAGSAIAATIGAMRVSEQIDALNAMAVDPVQYLVSPRMVAGLLAGPILATLFILAGLAAGYLFGVGLLRLDGGIFIARIHESVDWSDVSVGLLKSVVFAGLVIWIATYRGYFTEKGAVGVGGAATRAVVETSILILLVDYLMTALLY